MTFTAGQKLTAAELNKLDAQDVYTPTLLSTGTTPNVGADGFVQGRWHRMGRLIWFSIEVLFDGVGVDDGTGFYQWSLPFDADTGIQIADATAGAGTALGAGFYRAPTETSSKSLTTVLLSASQVRLAGVSNAFAPTASTPVQDGTRICLEGTYIADEAGLP